MKKIISFICVSVFASVSLFARDIVYKVSTFGNDANDGLTWSTAKRTYPAALALANTGDEIWIAAGTYYPTEGDIHRYRWGGDSNSETRYFSFKQKSGVKVYGGFPTSGDPGFNDRDPKKFETVFSGNIGSQSSESDNSYCVIYNTNETLSDSTLLDGLVISDGYDDGKSQHATGIRVRGGIVRNCTIRNNKSIVNVSKKGKLIGDWVYATASTLPAIYMASGKLESCEITNNTAQASSYCFNEYGHSDAKANPISAIIMTDGCVENCTFYGNTSIGNADAKPGSYAGMGYRSSTSVNPYLLKMNAGKIINSTFYHNKDGNISLTNGKISFSTIISTKVFITNSCFVENSIIFGETISPDSCTNVRNCVMSTDYNGTSIRLGSPGFFILGYNGGYLLNFGYYGGYVQTIPVKKTGAAVNVGFYDNDVPTDARGMTRSTTPTIGAYEYIEPEISIQPTNMSFNVGDSVSFSISASSRAGEVTYQWQVLNSLGEWEDIKDATSPLYLVKNCTSDLNNAKYRCIIKNICDGVSVISDEVILAENTTLTNASLQTTQASINDGGYAYLKVSHDASEPTFKWYVSSDYGTTYTEIDGATSSTLEFLVDRGMNRYLYKCVVTSKNGTVIETTPTALIINDSAITISKDIYDKIVKKGETAKFEVDVASEDTLRYQWQNSIDNWATWLDLENETSPSLSISDVDYSLDGNYYRLKVDNGCGYIYSIPAKLTVYRHTTIISQPMNLYVFEGNTASFSVGVDYSGVLTYQWQEKVDGVWQNIDGATSETLSIVDMQESYSGRTFRCVITNGNISKLSDEAVLTLATDAIITSQPTSIDLAYIGKQALFSVEVKGYNLSYQWYVIGGYGTQTPRIIEGATSSTLIIDVDENIIQNTYYCEINDTKNTLVTNKVSITEVKEAIYYTLTVENGSGGGTVASGDTVQIVADAPADGMVFDKWVGDVETVADVSASTTTIRMPAKNATVTATYIEKPVVDPFGDAVVYPNVAMTILGEVDFFGSPANSGCVVAAYVGNELRGKSSVVDISGRSLVNLTVNVNANGEEIKFKIWTPSDGKIIDARADCTAVSASGDSLGSLDSPFAIVFANDLNLELLLKEGWNQVSFNVGLENMAVRTILSDVIDNVALVQGSGTSFNPSWPDSLNTLKSFNNTSGFWVKMNAASSVSLTGSALDVSAKTISLNVGWNNIGYTPATAASIRTVLATALDDGKIERIINSKGNFNPATPDVLNSLKTMTPGEGYWVKANAATTIAYDKITTAKRAMRKSRAVIFAANSASENFGEPVVYPNVQMTILANVLVNGAAAPSGSVVAAFVDGELRAKQEIVSLDGKSIANLTVSVAQNGETIGFKIWNSATGETLDFATSVAAESGAAPYTYPDNLLELSASGTPSVGGDTEPAEPVVYPNTPMSLYVEVQIDGKTVSDGDIVAAYVGDELRGKQSVVIYDGKAIANLVVNVAYNGEKIAFKVWNASAKRLYAAAKTIDAEIGGEPYTYPDNLLLVNAQTATGGLALWTSKNGLSGDNANALATPFNDGITNIEKFAFGLSGNKAASYSENALFKQSYSDGKASFQFPISKDATDSVNVKVMTSEDLVNWMEAPSANIGTSGDFNLMQTEQTVPEGGKLFFKLVVEEK